MEERYSDMVDLSDETYNGGKVAETEKEKKINEWEKNKRRPRWKDRSVEERREGGRKRYDPLVVSCAEMRKVLLPTVEYHDQKHADWCASHGSSSGCAGAPIGGIYYIAQQVGVDPRRVREIFNCKQKYMAIHIADEWLGKLGLEYERPNLRPVANPLWSLENWMEWASLNGGCEQIGVTFETEAGS
jgi:hypothetical protein